MTTSPADDRLGSQWLDRTCQRMLIVASDEYRAHNSLEIDNGVMIESSENAHRADAILSAVVARGHEVIEPAAVDLDLIRRVHTPDDVDFLTSAWDRWIEREDGPAAMAFAWPARGLPSSRLVHWAAGSFVIDVFGCPMRCVAYWVAGGFRFDVLGCPMRPPTATPSTPNPTQLLTPLGCQQLARARAVVSGSEAV